MSSITHTIYEMGQKATKYITDDEGEEFKMINKLGDNIQKIWPAHGQLSFPPFQLESGSNQNVDPSHFQGLTSVHSGNEMDKIYLIIVDHHIKYILVFFVFP